MYLDLMYKDYLLIPIMRKKHSQRYIQVYVFIRRVYYIVPYAYFVVPTNNKGYKLQLTTKIIY